MARLKAIFYLNSRDSSGNIYTDLNSRVSIWQNLVKDFLGEEYDLLVVPVLNRETELVFAPQAWVSPISDPVLLNEKTTKGKTTTE